MIDNRYDQLKSQLESLHYFQNFGVESIPLVETLISDLLRSFDNFQLLDKKCKKVISDLETSKNNYEIIKNENVRISNESNSLHVKILRDSQGAHQKENDSESRLNSLQVALERAQYGLQQEMQKSTKLQNENNQLKNRTAKLLADKDFFQGIELSESLKNEKRMDLISETTASSTIEPAIIDQLEGLSDELETAKKQLETKESCIEHLENTVKELTKKKNENYLNEQIGSADYSKINSDLRLDVDRLRSRCKDLLAQLLSSQQAFTELQNRRESRKSSLSGRSRKRSGSPSPKETALANRFQNEKNDLEHKCQDYEDKISKIIKNVQNYWKVFNLPKLWDLTPSRVDVEVLISDFLEAVDMQMRKLSVESSVTYKTAVEESHRSKLLIHQYGEKSTEHQMQISSAVNEIESLKKELNISNLKFEKLKQNYDDISAKLNIRSEELFTSQRSHEETLELQKKTEKQLSSLREFCHSLEDHLSISQSECNILQETAEQQLHDVKIELKNKKNLAVTTLGQLEVAEQRCLLLEGQIEFLNEENKDMKKSHAIDDLLNQITKLEEELKIKKKELENESETNEQIQSQLVHLRNTNKRLTSDMQRLQAEIDSKERVIYDSKQQVIEMKDVASMAEETKHHLTARIRELQILEENGKREKENISAQLSKEKQKIEELTNHLNNANETIASLDTQSDNLQMELNSQSNRINVVNSLTSDKDSQISSLQLALENLEHIVATKDGQIANRQSQLQALQEKLHEQQVVELGITEQLMAASQQICLLEQDLTSISADNEDLHENLRILENSLSSLKNQKEQLSQVHLHHMQVFYFIFCIFLFFVFFVFFIFCIFYIFFIFLFFIN
eukprot:GHVL01012332.1.p1 GENE.GHVL01012332.1~~GHVL01012332.1.p1  ORF type:complete len:854 (+),score=212.22 GHVL01012332.1:42-2603(+)